MNKRLRAQARSSPFLLGSTVTLGTIAGVIVILQAGIIANIINRAFLQQAVLGDVIGALMSWLIVILVRALMTAGSLWTAGAMAIRIKQRLRQRVMAHLTALGPAYTAGERSGELTATLTEGIEALDAYFREYVPSVFLAILIPLIFLIVTLPIDGLTFVVMLVTAPLIPLFMVLIGMAAGTLARSQYAEMSFLSAHFLEVMQGLATLKLFNRSKHQITTIARITDQFREATMKVLRVAFLSALTLELLATVSVAIVAVEIGLRLLAGGISFESALFLLIIAPDFYQPLRTLSARFHSGTEGSAAAERLFAILDTAAPAGQIPTGAIPGKVSLRIEQVSVAYGEQRALDNLSLEVHPGEHLAIVGASGSGKSTLAGLLLRFILPTQGRITVDGIDLQTLDLQTWRRQIAWVGQTPHLFAVSVADNIRLGAPDTLLSDVIRAATQAEAHDFIRQLPQGYDTLCGEGGTTLSGGQRQRIALARAFLRNAPLWILDEATAQLDPVTEAALTRTIDNLRDKTLILIAHRLRTVINADRIIVLDHGRLREQGTHTELMARGGLYRYMVDHDDTID